MNDTSRGAWARGPGAVIRTMAALGAAAAMAAAHAQTPITTCDAAGIGAAQLQADGAAVARYVATGHDVRERTQVSLSMPAEAAMELRSSHRSQDDFT